MRPLGKEVYAVSKEKVQNLAHITAPRNLGSVCPWDCGIVPGVEECYDQAQIPSSGRPKEEVSLEPSAPASMLPSLCPAAPKKKGVDVPNEMCIRTRTNPRKVKKSPVVPHSP